MQKMEKAKITPLSEVREIALPPQKIRDIVQSLHTTIDSFREIDGITDLVLKREDGTLLKLTLEEVKAPQAEVQKIIDQIGAVYLKNKEKLVRLAIRILGSEFDKNHAEDATHEAFIRAIEYVKKRPEVAEQGDFQGLLALIVKQTAFDLMKRAAYKYEFPSDELDFSEEEAAERGIIQHPLRQEAALDFKRVHEAFFGVDESGKPIGKVMERRENAVRDMDIIGWYLEGYGTNMVAQMYLERYFPEKEVTPDGERKARSLVEKVLQRVLKVAREEFSEKEVEEEMG